MTAVASVKSFVLCQIPGSSNAVRALPVTDQAQTAIEAMIKSQCDNFIDPGLERVDFDPTYITDDESIMCISGFELPEHIADIIAAPGEVPYYTAAESDKIKRTKAIFHIDEDGNIYFQCWRNFTLLGREKLWLLLAGDTLDLEQGKFPIGLEHRLDAILWEGDLLFRSYANTSSMLELLDYVIEATTEDIELLVACELFEGDLGGIMSQCSRLQKKHIRVLIQNHLLDGHTVEELIEKATEVRYNIPQANGKIALPNGGRALTELLQFLGDRVYCGPVTGESLVANSARRRAARQI